MNNRLNLSCFVSNEIEKAINHKYLRIENGKYIYDYNQMSAKDHNDASNFHEGEHRKLNEQFFSHPHRSNVDKQARNEIGKQASYHHQEMLNNLDERNKKEPNFHDEKTLKNVDKMAEKHGFAVLYNKKSEDGVEKSFYNILDIEKAKKGVAHKKHKYLEIKDGKYIYNHDAMSFRDHRNVADFHEKKSGEQALNPTGVKLEKYHNKLAKTHRELAGEDATYHEISYNKEKHKGPEEKKSNPFIGLEPHEAAEHLKYNYKELTGRKQSEMFDENDFPESVYKLLGDAGIDVDKFTDAYTQEGSDNWEDYKYGKTGDGASGKDTFLTPENNERNPNDPKPKKVKDVIDKLGNYKEGSVELKDGKLVLKKGEKYLTFDNLQKGVITNSFQYDNNIKIEKSGAQIKEKLFKIQTQAEGLKSKHYTDMTVLLSKIGCDPTEEDENKYALEGYESLVDVVPKTFKWSECYSDSCEKVSEQPIASSGVSQTSSTTPLCDEKRKYNSCVSAYIDACKDIIQIETMLNNLKDGDKYPLTIKQATTLGF